MTILQLLKANTSVFINLNVVVYLLMFYEYINYIIYDYY